MAPYKEKIEEYEAKKNKTFDRKVYIGMLKELFEKNGLLAKIAMLRHATYNSAHPIEIYKTDEAKLVKVMLEVIKSMDQHRGITKTFWGMEELVGENIPLLQDEVDPRDLSFPDDISRAWVFLDRYTLRFHVVGSTTICIDELCRKRVYEILENYEKRPGVQIEAYTIIHDVCVEVIKMFKRNLNS